MTKLSEGWISLLISILTTIALIGIAWGITQEKIETMEKDIVTAKNDHDVIITCKVKLDNMSEDILTIKGDIKEIKTLILSGK